ncbi:hypothetical protein LMG667_02670 [Xanthomonas euvesicatoria]|uniref:hypothetical protein n=1 Tax=Xanthomonas euvesicatoria TaxID=456327 RepID=UPI00080E15D3|nr:hypothetical protein [Xanthomonas euvesicatoria]OCG90337.1 hypothetical protein LMG667_02670 [Xanthomonas euvesicatoria]
MDAETQPALVAVDIDGPVLSCFALRSGEKNLLLEASSAIELNGPNPVGLTVYEADRKRFVVRAHADIGGEGDIGLAARRVRQVDAVLRTGYADNHHPTVMVSSMPLADYFQSSGQASSAVQDLEQRLTEAVTRLPTPAAINLARFKVVPRTVGAFMDWAFDDDGEPVDPGAIEKLVVVDVGLTGTNVVGFDARTQEIDHTLMESKPGGFARSLSDAADMVSTHHGVEIPAGNTLLQAAIAGVYRFQGVRYSVERVLQKSLADTARWVADLVRVNATHAHVLVVGVGAKHLAAALLDEGVANVQLPDRPEHANARGMAKFAVLVWREGL